MKSSILAAICGNPGIPENGGKDGTVYQYPHTVTYNCHRGYILRGQKSVTCQSNGHWSSPKPQCTGNNIKSVTYISGIELKLILYLPILF